MCLKHVRRVAWLFAGALAMTLMARPAPAELTFGIPTPTPGEFNVDGGYGYAWLPEDQLDIYFTSDRPGPNSSDPYSTGAWDIWTSHRDSLTDPWQPIVNLGSPINTPDRAEFAASFTADGQHLFFMRADHTFGLANGDLFVSHRQVDNTWGEPEPLVGLNTDGIEANPAISPDGLTLYFNTVGNENYPSPTGLNWNTWVAHRTSTMEEFTDPEFFFGGYGTVSPDGLTHIFFGYPDVADYYDVPNVGDGDLYIRTRDNINEEFGPVQFVKPPVSGSGQFLEPPLTGAGLECCAMLPASGSTLYFTAIRPGTDTNGPNGFVDMWQVELAESVPIDIKPGSSPSPINLKSKGVLPVAILSTEEFDATQVDIETLLFGDPLLIADGKTPVSPLRGNYDDVNDDGLMDLTLKFSMRDLVANEVIGSMTVEGYLAGQAYDGTEIAGRETVRIVPAGSAIPEPSGMLLMLAGLLALTTRRKRLVATH